MDKTETQTSDKSRRKKAGNIISSAVLAAAILFCFCVLVQVSVKGYVSVGGFSLFRVVTGSMEPTISTGSLIISKNEDINNIKEGAVSYTHLTPTTHISTDHLNALFDEAKEKYPVSEDILKKLESMNSYLIKNFRLEMCIRDRGSTLRKATFNALQNFSKISR